MKEQAETAEDSFHVVVIPNHNQITASALLHPTLTEEDYGHAQDENQEKNVHIFKTRRLGQNI